MFILFMFLLSEATLCRISEVYYGYFNSFLKHLLYWFMSNGSRLSVYDYDYSDWTLLNSTMPGALLCYFGRVFNDYVSWIHVEWRLPNEHLCLTAVSYFWHSWYRCNSDVKCLLYDHLCFMILVSILASFHEHSKERVLTYYMIPGSSYR